MHWLLSTKPRDAQSNELLLTSPIIPVVVVAWNVLPFLLQCLGLLKRITSDCWNLIQFINGNHSTAAFLQFNPKNTLHLSCVAAVRMDSLGTPSRPFSSPPTFTCLNFNPHAFLCTLKTNFLAEISSSAALILKQCWCKCAAKLAYYFAQDQGNLKPPGVCALNDWACAMRNFFTQKRVRIFATQRTLPAVA